MDKKSRLFELIVIFICYGVFLKNTAPTIFPGDSPEIITGTLTLGVIHGLSFPFAVVLGNLFQYLPLGGLAWRINLFSVFCGMFSVFLLMKITLFHLKGFCRRPTYIFWRGCGGTLFWNKKRFPHIASQKNIKRSNHLSKSGWQSQLLKLWLVLLLLGGTAFKYQVIRAEVYVQFTALFLMLVWLADLVIQSTDNLKRMRMLSLLILGMAASVHVYLSLPLLLILPLLMLLYPRLRTLKVVLSSLIILIIACSIYLYVPIRAVMSPPVNFGDMATLGSIQESFLRFNRILHVKIDIIERIKNFFRFFQDQMSLPGLVLVIWGLTICLRKNWKVGILICLIAGVNILSYFKHIDFAPTHLDTLGYLLLSVIVLILLARYAFKHVAELLNNRGTVLRFAIFGIVTLFFVSRAAANWSAMGERNNRIAYNFAVDTINSVGQGHIIMKGNTLTFPLAYLSHVEGRGRRIKYYNPFDGGIFTLIKHPSQSATVEVERERRFLVNQVLSDKRPLYSGMMLFGYNYYNLNLDWEIDGLAYRLKHEKSAKPILTRYFHWPINERLPFDNKSRRTYAIYLFRQGETAFNNNKNDVGETLWLRAAEASNDDAVFLADLGTYFLDKKMVEPGISLIKQGLALNPTIKAGYTNLAMAYYYGKGDQDTALRYAKKALEINPQDNGASQLLKEIKRTR